MKAAGRAEVGVHWARHHGVPGHPDRRVLQPAASAGRPHRGHRPGERRRRLRDRGTADPGPCPPHLHASTPRRDDAPRADAGDAQRRRGVRRQPRAALRPDQLVGSRSGGCGASRPGPDAGAGSRSSCCSPPAPSAWRRARRRGRLHRTSRRERPAAGRPAGHRRPALPAPGQPRLRRGVVRPRVHVPRRQQEAARRRHQDRGHGDRPPRAGQSRLLARNRPLRRGQRQSRAVRHQRRRPGRHAREGRPGGCPAGDHRAAHQQPGARQGGRGLGADQGRSRHGQPGRRRAPCVPEQRPPFGQGPVHASGSPPPRRSRSWPTGCPS